MTPDKDILHEVLEASSRRSFLRRSALAGAAAVAAPAALASFFTAREAKALTPSPTLDIDILNFALNLEYLEAQYYSHGIKGVGLPTADTVGGDGTAPGQVIVRSNPKVTFENPAIEAFLTEITQDETDHVLFIRKTLAAAGNKEIAQPTIDLVNSFNAVAKAAGLGDSFDPYADEINFMLGGFLFEDVGVTAYHGAAALIDSKTYLTAAAGILAVEGYHASELRASLYLLASMRGDPAIISKTTDLAAAINKIDGNDYEQGIRLNSTANIVPTDSNALAFARNTTQVLKIVYGNSAATPGGFFPDGVNGAIK